MNSLFGASVTTAGLLPGTALQAALAGRRDLDLALLPGEAINDDGLFIDSMSLELLSAGVPMELRLSKDFVDALHAAGGGVSKPTVAIVGRPNVGKSTLFNRIVGGRPAIVSDRPGTTRDRHFGDAEWQGRQFWLVDTGGLVPDSDDSMDRAIRQQVEFALAESDVVVFVVDGREGLNPVDRAIAERLRQGAAAGAARGEQAGRSRAQHRPVRLLSARLRRSDGRERGGGEGERRSARRRGRAAAAARSGGGRARRSTSRWSAGPTSASRRSSTGCSARSATWSRPRPAPRATRSTRSCGFKARASSSSTPQGYAVGLK